MLSWEGSHTFKDRIRNQDGFHELKKQYEKYIVLFGKWEGLMTSQNEQLISSGTEVIEG